jgi:hypothetical protein
MLHSRYAQIFQRFSDGKPSTIVVWVRSAVVVIFFVVVRSGGSEHVRFEPINPPIRCRWARLSPPTPTTRPSLSPPPQSSLAPASLRSSPSSGLQCCSSSRCPRASSHKPAPPSPYQAQPPPYTPSPSPAPPPPLRMLGTPSTDLAGSPLEPVTIRVSCFTSSTLHFSTLFPQRAVSSFSYINYGLDQLQHPLVFLCAICSLYVKCHALSGYCKRCVLQIICIQGFL